MNRRQTFGLLLIAAVIFSGCSNQWRRVDIDMNSGDVFAVLDDVRTTSTSSGPEMTNFFNLRETEGISLYFAYGPSPMGPVISILSLATFDFLGAPLNTMFYDDFESVRVAYIEAAGSDCALMIDVKIAGGGYETQYYSCTQPPYVEEDEYVAVLKNGNGTIALRSNDVDKDGNLLGVIQMRISQVNSAGNDIQIGKFSTLVGFGP